MAPLHAICTLFTINCFNCCFGLVVGFGCTSTTPNPTRGRCVLSGKPGAGSTNRLSDATIVTLLRLLCNKSVYNSSYYSSYKQ